MESIEPELAEIIDADRAAIKRIGQRVIESAGVWTSIAGLVGTALSSLPAIVPAAFAVTTLATLGSAAVASKNDRASKLGKSPWSLVYYARRLLDSA